MCIVYTYLKSYCFFSLYLITFCIRLTVLTLIFIPVTSSFFVFTLDQASRNFTGQLASRDRFVDSLRRGDVMLWVQRGYRLGCFCSGVGGFCGRGFRGRGFRSGS